MDKQKLIIVEGPQGTGKSTLTNYLRDNLAGSNLYRLSGQKDKSMNGRNMSVLMYAALINYLKVMETVPMDIIFDRTFFTEEVYARLGYKDYSFTDDYKRLLDEFSKLEYDMYFFSLYLENEELFKTRLDRESHHNYQSFSVQNSVNQQNIYKDICNDIKTNYPNINVVELAMDNFDEAYHKVNETLGIKVRKR